MAVKLGDIVQTVSGPSIITRIEEFGGGFIATSTPLWQWLAHNQIVKINDDYWPLDEALEWPYDWHDDDGVTAFQWQLKLNKEIRRLISKSAGKMEKEDRAMIERRELIAEIESVLSVLRQEMFHYHGNGEAEEHLVKASQIVTYAALCTLLAQLNDWIKPKEKDLDEH